MDIKNKRLTDDEFYEIRKTILNQWPTGKDVDLEEAFAFHKSLPDSKIPVLIIPTNEELQIALETLKVLGK